MHDEQYMRYALELARKGLGWVNPNPLVGAVIVQDGMVIGRGWHERYGGLHAEVMALAACGGNAPGATLYVNLEPCCHQGKTPPCTEAIIAAGISRVVVGAKDVNPLVASKGISRLRQCGIEVTENVLESECRDLNAIFYHYITGKVPYVIIKYAMTMDGKIAAYTGKSQWITGEAARKHVHKERHRCMAIMVGVNTVLADNPLLTCRLENSRNPLRIICDTHLRMPLSAQVVHTAAYIPTIIATAIEDEAAWQPYTQAGCNMLPLPIDKSGHIDIRALMEQLGERGIDSVLAEGGATLNWSLLEAGLAQKVQAYIAPKLLGGAAAPAPIGGLGCPDPNAAFKLVNSRLTMLDEDFLIESDVFYDM